VYRRDRTGSTPSEEERRPRAQLDGHGPRYSRVGLAQAGLPNSAAATDRRLAHGGVSLASRLGPVRCGYQQGSTIDSHVPRNRTKTMLSRPQRRTKSMPSRANLCAASPIWARLSVRDGRAGRRSAAPVRNSVHFRHASSRPFVCWDQTPGMGPKHIGITGFDASSRATECTNRELPACVGRFQRRRQCRSPIGLSIVGMCH
jgi:hypothetical protein